MRDYIAKASVVVMPLRVGAGTKHRVFQALCMKKAVVCTPVAAEGIALKDGGTAMLANDADSFADARTCPQKLDRCELEDFVP
jgi:hypothetical protein